VNVILPTKDPSYFITLSHRWWYSLIALQLTPLAGKTGEGSELGYDSLRLEDGHLGKTEVTSLSTDYSCTGSKGWFGFLDVIRLGMRLSVPVLLSGPDLGKD
jgi:hypothetical protein